MNELEKEELKAGIIPIGALVSTFIIGILILQNVQDPLIATELFVLVGFVGAAIFLFTVPFNWIGGPDRY